MIRPEVGYQLLPEKIYEIARSEAFPVSNIAAHDVSYDRSGLKYVGSKLSDSGWLYDFYQGPDEKYWFKKRKYLENGKLVSEHFAIFGYEEGRRRRWKRDRKKEQ